MNTNTCDKRFTASRSHLNVGKRFIRAPGKVDGFSNSSFTPPRSPDSSGDLRRFIAAKNASMSLERQARHGVSLGTKASVKTLLMESEKTITVATGADGSDDVSAINSSIKKGAAKSSRFLGNATSPVVRKGKEQAGRFAKRTADKAGKTLLNKVSIITAKKEAAKSAAAKSAASEAGKRITLKALLSAAQGTTVAGSGSVKAALLNPYVALGILIALLIVAVLAIIVTLLVYASTYTYLIKNPLPDSQKSPFVNAIATAAIQSGAENDVLPSVIIAQAMLESTSGTSVLASRANNLFGIKGQYDGKSYFIETLEYAKDGSSYTVKVGFRQYPSWAASILDHGNLLQKSRYAKVRNEPNYIVATQALYNAGYATDPEYASKLQKLIQTYNLTQYDSGWGSRNGADLSAYLDSLPTSKGKIILASASTMLGWQYSQEKASTTSGYTDCSFLVQNAYARIGVSLPRTSYAQAEWCVENGYEISFCELQPGDLIFYSLSTTKDFRSVTHVAIYCGEGMLIEASSSLNAVVYRPTWGLNQIVCVAHPFTNDT